MGSIRCSLSPFIFYVLIIIFLHSQSNYYGATAQTASCDIKTYSGIGPVMGNITLTQLNQDQVELDIQLTDLPQGKHGFHIHVEGDLSNNCTAAGGHYNPFNKVHGGPTDQERHVGDLGNIEANANRVVDTKITDGIVKLTGDYSVIGRAIVVHQDEDDLGKGSFPDSNMTGHAGARLGCCVIVLSESAASTVYSSIYLQLFIALVFLANFHL